MGLFTPKYAPGTEPTASSGGRRQQREAAHASAQANVDAAVARQDQAAADYRNIPRKDRSHRTREAIAASNRMLQAKSEYVGAVNELQRAEQRRGWFR